MKIVAPLFAVLIGSTALFGQEPASSRATEPTQELVSERKERAPEALTPPTLRSPLASKLRPSASGGLDPVRLWTLIASGGWAMIPLAFLSVLTVMLVFLYLFTLRRGSVVSAHYMNTAEILLKKRDYLGLLAISNRHSESVARVVQRTLDFATKNPTAPLEVIKEIAQSEGQSQAASLQHRTVFLADIGMLAPMIGLLGTVLGIIRSFGVLGNGQTTTSRDVLLAAGVSEALVATASGLILGIIAMAFYSVFRNRVQSLISDLEIASAHVLALVAVNYNKKRESSRLSSDDEF